MITQSNTQTGGNHIKAEHTPHDPVQIMLNQEDRSSDDSQGSNNEKK
jgi:hypothetical protein